jgi:hypothetical protein
MPARAPDARLCVTVDGHPTPEAPTFHVFVNPLFDTTEPFANDPVPPDPPRKVAGG